MVDLTICLGIKTDLKKPHEQLQGSILTLALDNLATKMLVLTPNFFYLLPTFDSCITDSQH